MPIFEKLTDVSFQAAAGMGSDVGEFLVNAFVVAFNVMLKIILGV